MDAELAIDLGEVVLDRLRAEEEGLGRLLVARARGDGPQDLKLLRRQLVETAGIAPARRLTGGLELGAGALCPRRSLEAFEELVGDAQVLAGLRPRPRPAEPLAVVELDARPLERVGVLVVEEGERLPESPGRRAS